MRRGVLQFSLVVLDLRDAHQNRGVARLLFELDRKFFQLVIRVVFDHCLPRSRAALPSGGHPPEKYRPAGDQGQEEAQQQVFPL